MPIDGTVLSNEPQRRKDAAGAVATLDLGAVRRNYRARLRELGPNATCALVIGAVGATQRAKVLIEEGCRDFHVARIIEGVNLRKALRAERPDLADKEVAIHVMDGHLAGSNPQWLAEHHLTPVVPAVLPALQAAFEAGGRPLEQELTLTSRIAQVRQLSSSDAIGYGSRYVAGKEMPVATIPIGYADGMPRIGGGNRPGDAPSKAYVLVDGKHKAPLVGATSMDLTTIDLTGLPAEARLPGTPVTVLGGDITAECLDQMYGTRAHEVQTKLTRRVHLEVRDEARRGEAGTPPRGATAPVSLRRQAIENLRTERLGKEAAGAVLTLDLGAVRRNYRAGLQKLGQGVTPAAVIKADGYGLGATRLAKVLIEEGCRDFFVARISEGVDLRKALRAERPRLADKVAINVLDGNLPGSDPQWLIEHRLTPVLNSLAQVQAWNEAGRALKRQLPAILQVDTGMNRSGLPEAELEALVALLALPKRHEQHPGYVKLQFVMSHLANAGEVTPGPDGTPQPGEATRRQLSRFEAICKLFPGVKASIGASSTVYLGEDLQKDMVRMGGVFHGQAPFDADSNPLEQVLTLKSRIATSPRRVATLPIGYADGPPRVGAGDAPIQAYVLVDGKHKAPLVGATSMNLTRVDVSAVPPEARLPGTSVTVIGDGLSTDHMGQLYGTSASETQTKLTGRVHKVVIDEARPPEADTRRASANVWSSLRG